MQARKVGAEGRAADIVERSLRARGQRSWPHRLERRQHALAVGLSERDQAAAGGNPIRRSAHAGRHAASERAARHGLRRPPNRDRIGDRAGPDRRRRSSASQVQAARAISTNARPCAVVSRCRSRDGVKAAANSATSVRLRIVRVRGGAPRVRQQHRIAKACSFAQHGRKPGLSVGASVMSPASTDHSMPLE